MLISLHTCYMICYTSNFLTFTNLHVVLHFYYIYRKNQQINQKKLGSSLRTIPNNITKSDCSIFVAHKLAILIETHFYAIR